MCIFLSEDNSGSDSHVHQRQRLTVSLTGLLARVSVKQLKVEFHWLMLLAEVIVYMYTEAINLLV